MTGKTVSAVYFRRRHWSRKESCVELVSVKKIVGCMFLYRNVNVKLCPRTVFLIFLLILIKNFVVNI